MIFKVPEGIGCLLQVWCAGDFYLFPAPEDQQNSSPPPQRNTRYFHFVFTFSPFSFILLGNASAVAFLRAVRTMQKSKQICKAADINSLVHIEKWEPYFSPKKH